jgi:putative membrane protein
MNSEILIGHLLKITHIIFFIAGVGGGMAQDFLVRRFRNASTGEQEASEKMAFAVSKYVEFYGLMLALLTGLILGIFTGAFGTGGWLHAKSVLVVVLIGMAHVDLRHLKKIIALRAESKTSEIIQIKSRHLSFGYFNMLLVLLITLLAVMKPF